MRFLKLAARGRAAVSWLSGEQGRIIAERLHGGYRERGTGNGEQWGWVSWMSGLVVRSGLCQVTERGAPTTRYTSGMDSSTHEAVVDSPMLETKFFTPRWRTRQVVRTRLVDRLKRCVESKLTLVSAPPGFGKTTLLAEWLAGVARDEQHIAWLSLDERDNRPATFWTYVFRALDAVLPEGGKRVISLLQSAQPPPIETVLPMVLNEVAAASQQVVLVL